MGLLPRIETVTGKGARTPYLTRVVWGRLRLHLFHRGDVDPEPHDHPWDFWTLPLNGGYYEEVLRDGQRYIQLVAGLKHVKAEHAHRVLYPRWTRNNTSTVFHHDPEDRVRFGRWPIVTLVWTGRVRRRWGFWCGEDNATWIPWRSYFAGVRTLKDKRSTDEVLDKPKQKRPWFRFKLHRRAHYSALSGLGLELTFLPSRYLMDEWEEMELDELAAFAVRCGVWRTDHDVMNRRWRLVWTWRWYSDAKEIAYRLALQSGWDVWRDWDDSIIGDL